MVRGVLEVTVLRAQNPDPMKPKSFGRSQQSGFTLIEVLIVVIVVGVLLTIALPSFMDSIRKGRRSEAFTAMAALQQAQERHRSSNTSYSSTLPAGITATTGPSGYYALSLDQVTATGYIIIADGTSTGANSSQASDGSCGRLGVRVEGGSIEYASGATFAWAANNPCWSR